MAHFAVESLKHPMLQAVEDIEEKVGIKCLVVSWIKQDLTFQTPFMFDLLFSLSSLMYASL